MASLKGILFNQYAGEGLSQLIEELQNKYKPKKGRRFNQNDITYEISRPVLHDNSLEFEISSKIPQDELTTEKEKEAYFQAIKKIINSEKKKPVSVERENIVWDSKKETEKEREYVKLHYSYPLEDLYDDKEILKRCKDLEEGSSKEALPDIPGGFTTPGKIALLMVREKIQEFCREHVTILIEANKKVRGK
jgi:SpoVK/Ycf46/Vps4 family AAA+-type ATPase